MKEEFELIAKTFQGLEEVLAKELTELGANSIEIGRRMVAFTGDKEMMYKANFCLRTAIRILKPIKHFQAKNADEVYEAIKAIEWSDYLDTTQSFSVDAVVFSNEFRHSKFVAYRVKDAIVDYFREKENERPSVRINKPDLALNIHIAEDKCTLSLDSSGESLHRRGYRQEAVEAPLNEVLAAGMVLMSGWKGECDLIDPMCGSGTIPIEAALIARNIAPGVFRKEFAFEKWKDFNQELFDSIYNDDSKERDFEHKVYGFDNNPQAHEIAIHNVKAAGLSKEIILRIQPFQQFEKPKEKCVIITNPPYGERISTGDLLGLYQMIGERLKHAFGGNDAWILSYREECFDQIGLKPSIKLPLFNGSLECQFRKYQLFDGKYKEFRTENGDQEFKPRRDEFRSQRPEGGERKFSGERRFDASKPAFRSNEERPAFKRDGERKFDGERPAFKRDGERRFDGERPAFKRDGERRFDGDRPAFKRDGDRPAFKRDGERRFDGERPAFKRDGDRPAFKRDGERRFDGERPAFKRDGDRPAFKRDGERRFDGERPAFKRDGDRPAFKRDGDRPARRFDGNNDFSDRKPRDFKGDNFKKREE
ncbi:MAG: THUMP domain-containing protein [Phocaeicola sp.]